MLYYAFLERDLFLDFLEVAGAVAAGAGAAVVLAFNNGTKASFVIKHDPLLFKFLATLINPFSPQSVPHEFLISQ